MNDEKYIALCRRFYTEYGYFHGLSEFELFDAFTEFLKEAYDIFDSMGTEYRMKIQDIIDDVYEEKGEFYILKDDIDILGTVEEIEEMFRYANF